MQNIAADKVRLDEDEIALVVEGLDAGAQKYARLAEDATALGFTLQAADLAAKGRQFRSLASTARSARVTRMTVRHSV